MNEFLTNGPQAGPAEPPRSAIVPREAAGERFDKVLAELFPDYSRSRLAAWIRAGAVQLDGRPARPRDAVRGGEQVELRAPREIATAAAPQPIALSVLYEDAELLVIDKPAGLVVHPPVCRAPASCTGSTRRRPGRWWWRAPCARMPRWSSNWPRARSIGSTKRCSTACWWPAARSMRRSIATPSSA
jgi:hypothetical protein